MNIFDICWMSVSVFGKQPADCKLISVTISELDVELCQHFASRWHQFSDFWNLFVSLLCNISKTGKFYTHHARCRVFSCSRMRRTDWKLTGDRPVNKASTCKYFVNISWLNHEHLCIIFKQKLQNFWAWADIESKMDTFHLKRDRNSSKLPLPNLIVCFLKMSLFD